MKWTLELSDVPTNPQFPIVGFYESSPGVRSSQHLFSIEQVVRILENRHEADDRDTAEAVREKMIASPILPEGTIMYSKHPENLLEQVVFEIPQKTFDIRYKDTDVFHALAFPRMVVVCELEAMGNQKKIGTMRLFAVANDGKPISEDTLLFDFPYTNVMKGSGTVCWGQNERLLVDTLSEAKKALLLFFSAPFNEDHGVRTSFGINRFAQLIAKLENQPYSDEWLLPTNKKFGQMLKETSY